jgi:nucleoside-diphosphate-sugar epimerase
MPHITASDGPVAVTGAAGYIGSHIVLNLVQHGYQVRACVRDPTLVEKTAHLTLMNSMGPGSVELHRGDLEGEGSYDKAFRGVVAVFHAAAELGNNGADPTPESVYRLSFNATKWVIDSVKRAGTVKRIVYTSSLAAVCHPCPENHTYTEASWASTGQKAEVWNMDVVKRNRDIAYAMGKEDTEKYVYAEAEKMGIDAFGVNPCHVIGPLLAKNHFKSFAWQTRIGDMLEGYGHHPMMWNIVDVRDVAEAQRLIAECAVNTNGQRYNLVATDEKSFIPQEEVQAILQRFYPECGIGGNRTDSKSPRRPICYLEKCITQLGLKPHSVEEAIRDNADSVIAWGLVTMRPGKDNWQRKGKDLGLKSKFAPGLYPAMDPVAKKKILAEMAQQAAIAPAAKL